MRFVVDMNLSRYWVPALIDSHWEAEHWASIGRGNASDMTIIAYARSNGRVILTNDLDFGTILSASGRDLPSVIQIRCIDTSPDTIGPRVIETIRQAQIELEAGAFLSIDPKRVRLRTLPMARRTH